MSQPDPEQQRKKREQRAEQLRDEMSIELRVEQFNALLAEHNISAFSTFERESPKLEKDERFLLVRVALACKWYVFLIFNKINFQN